MSDQRPAHGTGQAGSEGAAPAARLEPPRAGERADPTLADYVDVVRGARWLVLGTAAGALLLAAAFVLMAQPLYRSDVLVQVEERAQGLGGADELSAMFATKMPVETEMEILRSRSLVTSVIERLGLDVEAGPRFFPVLGRAVARRWTGEGLRPAPPGLGAWAWGGERLRVDRLDLPTRLLGEDLRLVAREGGRFAVLEPGGRELLAGAAGAAAASGSGDKRAEIYVSELVARPGTTFCLKRLLRAEVVEELQRALRIAEKGKKTGIIQVSLEGPEPALAAAILDAVADTYLRQNVERKSAEAEKTLAFIEAQLPQLKQGLDRAEEQLNAYRLRRGQVDLSLEAKGALDRAVEIEKALTALDLERAELRQRFTESHPALATSQEKRVKLLAERAAVEKRLRTLPEAELDSARLTRDVKTSSELYLLLLNRAQELKVVKSGTIGNVRVIDRALVPLKPVSPRPAPTLALSLLLGLAVGVGAAFVRKALDRAVHDPDVVERSAGVVVYASVPHSPRQDELLKASRGRELPVLAAADPADLAIEALRSLRTALEFSLTEAHSNVLGIVGASPGVGKSFVAVNLAYVIGDAGRRVLLVDADLRRGRLHHYFGSERDRGLSELISGAITVEEAVRRTPAPAVDYIATGRLPPNPAELLASERFAAVLRQLAASYDAVLVDTAPILAVTDGAIVGRLAGVNILVLRAGLHPVREISLAAKRFQQNGVTLHGAVMNGMKVSAGGSGRYAYHYQYDYRAQE